MSSCTCEQSADLRVTGEVWTSARTDNVIGGGSKAVRVRCSDCGGKVTKIGSEVLTELFDISETDIAGGQPLDEDDRCTLEVDLI